MVQEWKKPTGQPTEPLLSVQTLNVPGISHYAAYWLRPGNFWRDKHLWEYAGLPGAIQVSEGGSAPQQAEARAFSLFRGTSEIELIQVLTGPRKRYIRKVLARPWLYSSLLWYPWHEGCWGEECSQKGFPFTVDVDTALIWWSCRILCLHRRSGRHIDRICRNSQNPFTEKFRMVTLILRTETWEGSPRWPFKAMAFNKATRYIISGQHPGAWASNKKKKGAVAPCF